MIKRVFAIAAACTAALVWWLAHRTPQPPAYPPELFDTTRVDNLTALGLVGSLAVAGITVVLLVVKWFFDSIW